MATSFFSRWCGALAVLLLSYSSATAQAPAWGRALLPDLGRNGGISGSAVDPAGNIYLAGTFRDSAVLGAFTLRDAGDGDVFVAKLSPAGQWLWAVRAGGRAADSPDALLLDPLTGTLTLTGDYSSDSAWFGPTLLRQAGTRTDLFAARLTMATGAWRWAVRAGSEDFDMGHALVADGAGGVYLGTEFRGDRVTYGPFVVVAPGSQPNVQSAALVRLDSTGTWTAAERVGGFGTRMYHLTVDHAGALLLSGYLRGSDATFGPFILQNNNTGYAQIFLAKRSAVGSWEWALASGGQDVDTPGRPAVDSADNIYLPGLTRAPSTFGPLTVRGSRNNAFVAKLSSAGQWQWIATAQSASQTDAWMVNVGRHGELLVAGDYSQSAGTFGSLTAPPASGFDLYAAQLSPAGQWQWVTALGGATSDFATGLHLLPNTGGILLLGTFLSDSIVGGGITLHNPRPGARSFQAFLLWLGGAPLATPALVAAPAAALAPNPATSTSHLTGAAPHTPYTLLDATGRVLLRGLTDATGSAQLDVAGRPAGVYVVRAGALTRRLVVQ